MNTELRNKLVEATAIRSEIEKRLAGLETHANKLREIGVDDQTIESTRVSLESQIAEVTVKINNLSLRFIRAFNRAEALAKKLISEAVSCGKSETITHVWEYDMGFDLDCAYLVYMLTDTLYETRDRNHREERIPGLSFSYYSFTDNDELRSDQGMRDSRWGVLPEHCYERQRIIVTYEPT